MEAANDYLKTVYIKNYNAEFAVKAASGASAFVPWKGDSLQEILCEHHERTVGKNNCISFRGLSLQIPKDDYRCHYVKATVRIHCYANGQMGVFHGPRKLAQYDEQGNLIVKKILKKAA